MTSLPDVERNCFAGSRGESLKFWANPAFELCACAGQIAKTTEFIAKSKATSSVPLKKSSPLQRDSQPKNCALVETRTLGQLCERQCFARNLETGEHAYCSFDCVHSSWS